MNVNNNLYDILYKTEEKLRLLDFHVMNNDKKRPWGGVLKIQEDQSTSFLNLFFPIIKGEHLMIELKPKVLIIEPGKCLSWYCHSHQTVFWKVLEGTVGILVYGADKQLNLKEFKSGELITIGIYNWYHLVGLQFYAVVATIGFTEVSHLKETS